MCRLVSYRDSCVCTRVALATLDKAGRASELVFRATNAEALRSAVAAGFGVMVVPRSRVPTELEVCDDRPLPPLPPLFCGIFVREGAERDLFQQLADRFAQTLRPSTVVPAPDTVAYLSPRAAAAPEAARPSI